MRVVSFLLIMIGIFFSSPVDGAEPAVSSGMTYGRFTPTSITKARFQRLYEALSTYRETFDAMPSSVTELVDFGYIDDIKYLVDARHPILAKAPLGQGPAELVDPFRVVPEWRDGAIATTDLPRDGKWIILNSDGTIDVRPVDPRWLGRYTPKRVSDDRLELFLDHPASRLGAVLSTGSTDSGRTGLGVDRIIPGFVQSRVDFRPDADLMPGDLILTIDGKHFDSLEAYDEHARSRPPATFSAWERPILEVIRNGELLTVCALNVCGSFPSFSATEDVYRMAMICTSDTGPGAIRADTEQTEEAGLRIKRTITDHTGAYIQADDILLRIDDEPVLSYLPSFYPMSVGEEITLTIERDGRILSIPFPLDTAYEYSVTRALDEIQMGQLDLRAVQARRDPNPEHVGIDLWIMGIHQSRGSDSAISEAERLFRSLQDHDGQFRFGHFKAWIGELHRSHRYTEALDLLGDGSRWFDRPDDRAELSVLRTQTLILAGRVEDAVEFAKRIPLDTDRFREAAFNATQRIMNAGYPEAVLDIAMVYRRAIPDDQELATGIEMLQEHLQSLEDAYYRD